MDNSPKMPPNESRAHILVATAIAFLVLDTVFVVLRFWSRRIQRTKSRPDDFFVVAALFVITGACCICIYATKHGGVGRHIQYVTKDQRIHWLKSSFIAAPCLYITSASLPKLAVMCIYLKIFADRLSRLCCWVIIVVLVTGPVVTIPVVILQCTPPSFVWNKTIPSGHCLNQAYMFRYGSLPNIITDVAMLLLPMPLIWNLHASAKVKFGLLITFLLGSIGLITSILRFVAFFTPIVDGTWAAVPLLCWIIIEPSIYLLAACLLTLKAFLQYLVHESTLSRLVSQTWSGVKSTRQAAPYIQRSDGAATRLPSEDEVLKRNILRQREFCVERSFDSNEAFVMASIPVTRLMYSRFLQYTKAWT